ncbi:MAG: response regulator [Lachnospiraceae bacterium]|nr:response regulator [Lachnospiraceae bacterium]
MKTVLFTIQYISIAGLFLECLIVFRRWKSMLNGYLFLSCVAGLVNNLGYLVEMKSQSMNSYLAALKMSYAGRVWLGLFLLLFVAELTGTKIKPVFRYLLLVPNIITYVIILNISHNSLYYTYIAFEKRGALPRLEHGNGPVHHIYMAMQVIYIGAGLFMLFRKRKREKDTVTRNRLFVVMLAILAEGFFFLLQVIGIAGITEYYDFTMLGSFVGTICMFVAIFSYDLLGTREIAREFVIDRISEAIIAVDDAGLIRYFNEPAKQLYPELAEGQQTMPEALIEAAQRGSTISIRDRIYMPEENALINEGTSYGKLYALVDETDHIRYMDELQKQKDIADKANETKSLFLANMSHEIRTPINAVLGMDEMILRESTERSIRSYASDIMSAGKTLLSLINDILDLSKVEAGRMELVPVQYELSSLINDLMNLIRDRAVKKGLKFTVDADPKIPHLLYGDETRIRQCVLNLLTNAVKYTENGSVILHVTGEPKDDTHIMLGFAVEDTGIGMKREDMEKLFSPYKRLEEKRNRAIEGTGLGMSITHHLLKLMGSELKVETEYGKGSNISFLVEQRVEDKTGIGELSARIGEGSREEESNYRELFHAPDARILVVDDTEMNLSVIENLLHKTEIRIDTALSGRDAIMLASSNPYDVIFIDHMMPDMDGIETLQHIRTEGKNTATPAVALTANAVSGAREMYLNAGFTDYISKPVDGVRLEKKLKSLLPQDKLMEPAQAEKPEDLSAPVSTHIMVVDDDETVCEQIREIMSSLYDVMICHSGKEGVSAAKNDPPALILLDVHLTDETGFAVMEELRRDHRTSDIPVLLITGDEDFATEENGFKSGASDFIRKPLVPDILRQRVKRIIDLHRYQRSIENEVKKQTDRSRRLTREMMLALSKTVDTKDHYTVGHSRRVGALCAEIGRRLGKSSLEQIKLYEIGLLHDIGKIGVHEDIIRKNTRLSDEEFKAVKEHTVKGYEILKEITDMPELCEGARWHHERFDGSGYPDALKGEEIPEFARIACIADCYDAMTSTRTYSVPREQAEVRAEIVRCRGSWFDPQIADALLAMIDEDKDYRMQENASSGEVWQSYEKLWENHESPDGTAQETVKLPEDLLHLQDLDTAAGLKNCGSVDGYLAVLGVFHQTAGAKADEIAAFLKQDNIKDYTIKVHALKSSARIIGAGALSALAKDLEDAGKREDVTFLHTHTDELLAMYRSLNAELTCLDGNKETGEKLEDKALKEAYQTIREIAQSMDYSLMDRMLQDLGNYQLAEKDRENADRIAGCLTQLDWDGIDRIAADAMERMR